jgi:DNA adenine methylase
MAPGAGFLKRGEDDKGISSRWYPETLAKRIERIHALRAKIIFREDDGLKVLASLAKRHHIAAFVDPPYTANGKGAGVRLYRHHDVDSAKLFDIAERFSGPMIITYHRSVIVRKQAEAVAIECRTVEVRTAHSMKRRELIMFKAGRNGSTSVGK